MFNSVQIIAFNRKKFFTSAYFVSETSRTICYVEFLQFLKNFTIICLNGRLNFSVSLFSCQSQLSNKHHFCAIVGVKKNNNPCFSLQKLISWYTFVIVHSLVKLNN